MVFAMAPENPSDGLPASVRFLLLALGEVIAAVVLYELFPFVPLAMQVFVILAAIVIVKSGRSQPNEEKTLALLLCVCTGVLLLLVRFSIIFVKNLGSSGSRAARNDLEFRVVFVGVCLVAALRLLDGRVRFRD
jgi:uncharacterized membrane protein